jgi:hypothetical protein
MFAASEQVNQLSKQVTNKSFYITTDVGMFCIESLHSHVEILLRSRKHLSLEIFLISDCVNSNICFLNLYPYVSEIKAWLKTKSDEGHFLHNGQIEWSDYKMLMC